MIVMECDNILTKMKWLVYMYIVSSDYCSIVAFECSLLYNNNLSITIPHKKVELQLPWWVSCVDGSFSERKIEDKLSEYFLSY